MCIGCVVKGTVSRNFIRQDYFIKQSFSKSLMTILFFTAFTRSKIGSICRYLSYTAETQLGGVRYALCRYRIVLTRRYILQSPTQCSNTPVLVRILGVRYTALWRLNAHHKNMHGVATKVELWYLAKHEIRRKYLKI